MDSADLTFVLTGSSQMERRGREKKGFKSQCCALCGLGLGPGEVGPGNPRGGCAFTDPTA